MWSFTPQDIRAVARATTTTFLRCSHRLLFQIYVRISEDRFSFLMTTFRNWTRYPISESDFRAAYASICSLSAQGLGVGSTSDVRFLPLLFVVLAIAVRLAPEDIAGDARNRRVTSLRYYWSCKSFFRLRHTLNKSSSAKIIINSCSYPTGFIGHRTDPPSGRPRVMLVVF